MTTGIRTYCVYGIFNRPSAYLPVDLCHGPAPGLVDLVKRLPSGRGESGREDAESMFSGITGRVEQPIPEALQAASSAFWLVFDVCHAKAGRKRAYPAKPGIMVVIRINDLKSERLCIPCALILADEVLLFWKYVRIAVVYSRADSAAKEAFDDSRRAWSTAGVKKNAVGISGSRDHKGSVVFHHLFCQIIHSGRLFLERRIRSQRHLKPFDFQLVDVIAIVFHTEKERDHECLASCLQVSDGVFHVPLRGLVGDFE